VKKKKKVEKVARVGGSMTKDFQCLYTSKEWK